MRRASLFMPLTAAAVAISLLSTLLLLAVVALTVTRESDRALAATIDTDVAGLADIYLTGGPAELRRRVGDRIALSQQQGEQAFYLVASTDGRKIAGNLAHWPDLAAERSELGTVEVGGRRVVARATQLPGNVQIVVGRSLGQRDALLRKIAAAVLGAGTLAALVSLVGGYLAARRLRGRVAAINHALARVEQGDIHSRAPDAERGDELGDLARHTNRTLAQVERLLEAHRDVSDHMAHEIRTPLLHLDAQLRSAIERTVDPNMTEWLSAARAEIRAIAQLLDALLDIAGAEALKGDLRGLGEIDLSALADTLADLYEDSADELGLMLSRRISPFVKMRGDPTQMTRLISNLLDNAFKYVPAGGTVRLAVEEGPRIVVEDDGAGIASEDRERIFDRYWRASSGLSNGHGLGLALARAIAERHGLAIRVEDAGPGARFVVAV